MISRRAKRLVVYCCVGLTTGCASFRAQEQRPNSWPPSPPGERQSIRLNVSMDASVEGRSHAVSTWQLEKVSSHVERVYQESGLFSSVQPGEGEAAATASSDLLADVRVRYTSTSTFGSTLISWITAFVIPSAYESALAATTTFSNGQGEVVGSIEKTATITTWEHILLLPVSFFAYPIPVYWHVFDDLNRVTLEEARSRGIL